MFLQSLAVAGRVSISSTMARRGSCFVSPTTKIRLTGHRSFSSTDWSVYYHIEANNAAREDATQLTVSGPDIDGILASMTVALAVRGCSLVELHAAKSVDTASHHRSLEQAETPMIHDVFYVVDRSTGDPFADDELEPLAKSLLESLKSPMTLVGVGGVGINTEKYQVRVPESPLGTADEQIKIIKSTDKP